MALFVNSISGGSRSNPGTITAAGFFQISKLINDGG
jgi:hypothetical protein